MATATTSMQIDAVLVEQHDATINDQSSEESPAGAGPPNVRYGKSLSSLTRKFVALLQGSQAGVLDLKEVGVGAIFLFRFWVCGRLWRSVYLCWCWCDDDCR